MNGNQRNFYKNKKKFLSKKSKSKEATVDSKKKNCNSSGGQRPASVQQDYWNLYQLNESDEEFLISQKLKFVKKFFNRISSSQIIEIYSKRYFVIDINIIQADKDFGISWPKFINDLTNFPQHVIDCFRSAMQFILNNSDVFKPISDPDDIKFDGVPTVSNSMKINVRFVGLHNFLKLRDLKSHLYGKFVTIKGTVVRTSDIKPMCLQLAFQCVKCKNTQVIPQLNGCYTTPNKCDESECSSYSVKPLRGSPLTQTVPWKLIHLQELNTDQCEGGRVPRNVECQLLEDLTDTCLPGDIVILSGVVKVNNNNGKATSSKDASAFLLYIFANSVTCLKGKSANIADVSPGGMQFSMADLQAVRDIEAKDNLFRLVVASICPGIYGHEIIKAGLVLSLFGGAERHHSEDDISLRGDSHVLIVGDPGLGKSQMLLACSNVSPRGVYVCGNSTTASGLTATVTKELGGENALEAGALVLADQGHCCIDEFDKMTQHSALLEAMEQQTISIAKSGMVCTLPARTSIIAAANPTGGHYNKAKTVSENLKMSGSLLSRFDLVFIVLDTADIETDRKMTEHVMGLHMENSSSEVAAIPATQCSSTDSSLWSSRAKLLQRLKWKSSTKADLIPQNLLRKYISYSRKYVKPALPPEVATTLQDFYLEMRKQYPSNNTTPITTRQLESLIRLTEARAKVELRDYCTQWDAEEVIEIMKYSMSDTFSDEFGNIDFDRSIHGSGMSKRSQMKKFINLLTQSAEHNGDPCFTVQQMHRMARRASMRIDVDNAIETLNTQGFLLKKGSQLYQIQTV